MSGRLFPNCASLVATNGPDGTNLHAAVKLSPIIAPFYWAFSPGTILDIGSDNQLSLGPVSDSILGSMVSYKLNKCYTARPRLKILPRVIKKPI